MFHRFSLPSESVLQHAVSPGPEPDDERFPEEALNDIHANVR